MNVPILTYHSQNIAGDDHGSNDHVALKEDLIALDQAGFKIRALDQLLDRFDDPERAVDSSSSHEVVLTFDDGCDFDVRDITWPGHGEQRSFLGILQDFVEQHGQLAQPELHATIFVIASAQARTIIDSKSLSGQEWISDSWWGEADAHPLLSIGSHGWDHNHPDLPGDRRGNFHSVDDHRQCLLQIVHAASAIELKTDRWPTLFAYPFGESSDYIRKEFFPNHTELHDCRAALGTEPGFLSEESDRWNLPRFVCGRDWSSASELLRLIS